MDRLAERLIRMSPHFYFAIFLISFVIFLFVLKEKAKEERTRPEPAPIVIRLDLTDKAMEACAKAFVRYGFYSIEEYHCRLEESDGKLMVSLYGPDYRDPQYLKDGTPPPVRKLGSVPLDE